MFHQIPAQPPQKPLVAPRRDSPNWPNNITPRQAAEKTEADERSGNEAT